MVDWMLSYPSFINNYPHSPPKTPTHPVKNKNENPHNVSQDRFCMLDRSLRMRHICLKYWRIYWEECASRTWNILPVFIQVVTTWGLGLWGRSDLSRLGGVGLLADKIQLQDWPTMSFIWNSVRDKHLMIDTSVCLLLFFYLQEYAQLEWFLEC